jgi:membrane associated rhomboid family serine protease
MFMHGSIWHILLNMLTLYYFGMYLSQLIGDKKLLLVYFAGGVLGNILFLLLAAPYSIAVGASGAIYALGGALVVMRPMLRVYIIPIPVPVPLWVVILLGFILVSPSVAWQAHLGGVIFGLIAGFFFRRQERTWRWR